MSQIGSIPTNYYPRTGRSKIMSYLKRTFLDSLSHFLCNI